MSHEPDAEPAAFSLESYNGAANLGVTEWADLIETRLIFANQIKASPPDERKEEHEANIRLVIDQLISDPLRSSKRPLLLFPPPTSPVVSPLTVADVGNIAAALQQQNPMYQVPLGQTLDAAVRARAVDDVLLTWLPSVGPLGVARINVRLDADEDEIVQQIRLLLKQYRLKGRGKIPPLTNNKLVQWHRNRVLPYADLLLWSRCRCVKLSQNTLSDLLLSHLEKTVSHPLRKIEETYEEVVRWEIVDALRGGTI